jgi:hypothetical protein
MAKERPLFSISPCSRFTEAAPLAAVMLSPIAPTTLISPGRSLCTLVGRVGDGAPGDPGEVSQGNGVSSGMGSWNLAPWGQYPKFIFFRVIEGLAFG